MVEVLALIVILGILVGIALPAYMGRVEKAERDVCEANRLEVKRHYETGLLLDDGARILRIHCLWSL